ncbi:MAG: glycoside hydrolase N-terminal domain-containing protein, partial [Prevotella sp.]|nr:glycoside hydrolase N-terminal domain-containing protein [Prevotella sp.]
MTYFDYIVSEFKTILKDEGVMLFFLFLPLVYPLLYSWIYNNEVTREVPIVVVDDSHTSLSREYIRKIDSSPDVCVAMQCRSIMEGRDAIGHGEAYGVVYFPRDFELKSVRGEQTHVGLYCDMSYLLNYKAIYQTVNKVNIEMWSKLQRRMQPKITMRDEAVAIHPLEFDEVPIFNVTGGYGNFILPAVLVLIIQQALLLGVGMLAGTRREKLYLTNVDPAPTPLAELLGRATAYFLIFAVMLAWITLIVPRIFGFVSLVHALDLFMLLLPYLVACVFFAIFMGNLVSYRESVMLVVVYTSLPLLFLSGVSWPQSSMPPFWQGVSYLFPSTFAIRGFIRMNSMGALLGDCIGEWITLWLQAVAYFLLIIAINKMNISRFLNNKGATATLLALVCVTSPTHAADDLTLWYNRPAQYWEEALPIGNGRIGAMISGSVETDTLQLNEDTFWSGSPYNNYNANCLPHLQEMRDLIAQGTAEGYIGAQKLALQNIVADIDKTGHGMAYESVGRLLLTFGHSSYTNYRRWLDLSTATAGVSYDCNGITYERTYFSSFIDKIIFVRLTAKKKGKYINPIKEKDVLTPKFKFLAPEKNDRVKIDIEKGDPSMIVIKSSLVKDSMEHVANKVEC